jgi:nicotinamide mononucleotide transporter
VKPATGALLALAVVAMTVLLTWVLRRYTNSTVPVLDSLITALSLVAQFMMTRKWLENWLVWITANCISVGLLIYKGLYVTSLLYLVFQVLCVLGLIEWWRALGDQVEATVSAD